MKVEFTSHISKSCLVTKNLLHFNYKEKKKRRICAWDGNYVRDVNRTRASSVILRRSWERRASNEKRDDKSFCFGRTIGTRARQQGALGNIYVSTRRQILSDLNLDVCQQNERLDTTWARVGVEHTTMCKESIKSSEHLIPLI